MFPLILSPKVCPMIRAANSPPHFVTLVCLTAISALTLNMFLPAMAEDFGVDYALMNVAIAGYLGVTALVQLIAGP